MAMPPIATCLNYNRMHLCGLSLMVMPAIVTKLNYKVMPL